MGVDGVHVASRAAAAVAGRMRRIVDAVRSAGATSPFTAHRLADLDLEEDWLVERLVNRQVLRQAEPGRYYLDEKAWQALRRARGRP